MDPKAHWENIYATKAPNQVSWYQDHPALSLDFIRRTGIETGAALLDVGGGASTLVDHLLADGFQRLTVLDLSGAALRLARQRLGPAAAARVNWIEADITAAPLPEHAYAVWHDRAVFHFLTQPADRQRYVAQVRRTVRPGGHVIVATFAADGPERCSGLTIARYDPAHLHAEFGHAFRLVDSAHETHQTPFGTEQKFIYCYCRME
jgi:ubiquinone/menaquinone biosynthesis C-methylase UbiE